VVSVSIFLLIVAFLIVALLTYQPNAASTLMGLLSGSRRRRALSFGPPIHRPGSTTQHSWAERVLQALRDRRNAAADTGGNVTLATGAPYIYISDSSVFETVTH